MKKIKRKYLGRKCRGFYYDLTGKRFGTLTVIEYSNNKNKYGKSIWRVRCDCGTEKEICGNALKAVQSCGCQTREITRKKTYRGVGEPGKGMSGSFWCRVRNNASARGFKLEITKEQAYEIYLRQQGKCALTGWEIGFGETTTDHRGKTASLDRIDSQRGYTLDNVQWVHKDVNLMKMDFDEHRFFEVCAAVTEKSLTRNRNLARLSS